MTDATPAVVTRRHTTVSRTLERTARHEAPRATRLRVANTLERS